MHTERKPIGILPVGFLSVINVGMEIIEEAYACRR